MLPAKDIPSRDGVQFSTQIAVNCLKLLLSSCLSALTYRIVLIVRFSFPMLAMVCFEIASSFDQHVDSVLHDFLMEDIRDVPEAPNFAGTSLRHVVTPVTRLANAVPSLSIRAITLL